MRFPQAALALALSLALLPSTGAPELHVLRWSPGDGASPASDVLITFDRPVAGSLDYSVPAESIFSISPAIAGRIEWRDPVTIRFSPRGFLAANTMYTVTVSDAFRAMDGGKLAQPFSFNFRVSGPQVLTGAPASYENAGEYLKEDSRFQVVYSAPVDTARLTAASYVEFLAPCAGTPQVRLRAVSQRRIDEKDDWRFKEAGGWQRQRATDSLRRVVQLAPVTPMPLGCRGALHVPYEVRDTPGMATTAWALSTHGDLRIVRAECRRTACPTGPAVITFSTPVRGDEVLRRVRLLPETKFTVRDSSRESDTWVLEASLKPRVAYAIVADTALHDIFGQSLSGNPAIGMQTTGYEPTVDYTYGRQVVERTGFGTFTVQSVNVDTLVVTILPIPDSLEAQWMSQSNWGYGRLWESSKRANAIVTRSPIAAPRDRNVITRLNLPVPDVRIAGTRTLMAVKVQSPGGTTDRGSDSPVALVQVTDLAVHARIGVKDGVVWVTGVPDGRARPGATVVMYDDKGKAVARAVTDAQGIARLSGFGKGPAPAAGNDGDDEGGCCASSSFEGYVAVTLGADRALLSISQYDPDLNPWHFNVSAAYADERYPRAAAVFTERGIYRPGEYVYAKAIIRDGALGALTTPARGDSIRWLFKDREQGTIKTVTTPLSAFGTAAQRMQIPTGAALGYYSVEIQRKTGGDWRRATSVGYRVAEYRPPEFLVELSRDSSAHFPDDTLRPVVQGRYLFGAPMGRAVVNWTARQSTMWWVEIPNADGFTFGDNGAWWEEYEEGSNSTTFASGADTLDMTGHRALAVPLPVPAKGRAAIVTVEASVADVNRQVVGTTTSVTVHPASFYVGAKPLGDSWFWTEGTPVKVDVIATRADGTRLAGIKVNGTVVRREWHQVRRERNGFSELVGDWVSDTVAKCDLTTTPSPVTCGFTPPGGGEYTLTLQSADEKGRAVTTSLERWATGKGWVPWNDESQFKMDVIPDKTRYSVGDTAKILFASPFTDAEAWVTVEREGIIEQRRLRLTSGATRLDFPITEKFAPNAYISIIVARGRSAKPAPPDDPGRPTIRVGYANIKVTPEVKRLAITVQPSQTEYRPGDSARVKLLVRDKAGKGRRAEVTLWAVDEGVLALTGYRTPDPISLLYAERGLGMRLASNLVAVAPQVPEGLKGRPAPGGGGGVDPSGVMRTRFQTTAFFLGSVITDTAGNAVAAAKLPDNLTTFRVMAVAVTAGDRYGKGESPMLVTKPLLARPALPRFVRNTDQLDAGVVVNQRAGGTPTVKVSAEVRGIEMTGDSVQSATLEAGRGREVRFGFRALPGAATLGSSSGPDSATFRFRVTDGADGDAVQKRIAIRPEYHPRSYTVAGVLRDTATATFTLPGDIDAERSRLTLSVGPSPLAVIRAAWWQMRVYPYDCTEQVSSEATVVLALYRAQQAMGKSAAADSIARGDPKGEIMKAVAVLSARQRSDGGIGYWSATDWTTPWLSSYAGRILVDAKAAGIAVDDSVLARLGRYLTVSLKSPKPAIPQFAAYYDSRRLGLSEQVAAADVVSRMGAGDHAIENSLLRSAAQMSYEDRLVLAEIMVRRGDAKEARDLLTSAWALVKVEGRRATLPDSVQSYFYFSSRLRPMARLLTATLAVDPTNQLIAPMVETLAQVGRAESARWYWNTQDLAAAVSALAAFERQNPASKVQHIRVRAGAGERVLLDAVRRTGPSITVVKPGTVPRPPSTPRDTTISLRGLLGPVTGEERRLTLSLDTPGDTSKGVAYYFLTVSEVPLKRPVTPDQAGIQVERWYENYETHKPVISVTEGDLVRVRLWVTVPTDREFVVLDDALPAGLEAVDLSLRTSSLGTGPGAATKPRNDDDDDDAQSPSSWWYFGLWDGGWWSPFDHREMRDDRVVYFATRLWPGKWSVSYIARATTPGVFVRPPAYAEEMYNPAVHGRSDGGVFTVTKKSP